jgi:mitochondrial import receptor subunit TOM40
VPPPPPPPSPEEASIAAAAAAATTSLTNPGPYEHVTIDMKQPIAVDVFDGFRCDISKPVSPHMMVNHGFWLGTSMLDGGARKHNYSCFAQVADERGFMFARVDPGRGSVDGRIQRAIFNGAAMAKIQLALSTEGQHDQAVAELDFGHQTWSGNIKYGSMGGTPCGVSHIYNPLHPTSLWVVKVYMWLLMAIRFHPIH